MYVTLDSGMIPSKYNQTIEKIISENTEPDLLPVWEVSEGKWKSFKISKMIFFLTSDELKKDEKSGFNVRSNITEIINDRKEAAINNFQDRVQELKEKAQEAKQNINGNRQSTKPVENTRATNMARDIINRLRTEAEQKRKGTS